MKPYQPDSYSIQFRRCADDLQQQGVAALTELYDLAAPRLVRYAVTLTRNQHDAEDVLQAAFVRIARNPERLSTAHHPWPYLLRVVRNEALRVIQNRRSQSIVETPSACVVHTEFDQQDVAESVRKALRQLPPMQAEVVVLKIWENMTFAQIGAVLETSQNTAASRYRYALEKLTMLLQPHDVEALHAL